MHVHSAKRSGRDAKPGGVRCQQVGEISTTDSKVVKYLMHLLVPDVQ